MGRMIRPTATERANRILRKEISILYGKGRLKNRHDVSDSTFLVLSGIVSQLVGIEMKLSDLIKISCQRQQ